MESCFLHLPRPLRATCCAKLGYASPHYGSVHWTSSKTIPTPPQSSSSATCKKKHEGTSIQATYNVLNDLHGAGLLRRIEPAGSPARFERRIDDNHHHLICRSCGDLHDIDCVVGEAPCLVPSDSHGFVLDEAEVVYWGLCPNCQTTTTNN